MNFVLILADSLRMDALGCYGNTHAITSDHGDTLGEHGLWGKNLLYEDCARVPLVFHHGGGRMATGVTRETATLLDLYPTFIAQAGAALPDTRLAGHALQLDAVTRGSDGRVVFGELANGTAQYFVRHGRWKLIKLRDKQLFELYDLDEDPAEQNNLADALPQRARKLDQRLQKWLTAEAPYHRPMLEDITIDWPKEMQRSHL